MIDDDVDGILGASRINNAAVGVTGMLVYNGKRFLQTLEGNAEDVSSVYNRISTDRRHHGMVILSTSDIKERRFGEWAMAGLRVDGDSESAELIRQVEALTAGITDRDVQAHFRSFAAVRPALRSAA
jgi:hypothetical protein